MPSSLLVATRSHRLRRCALALAVVAVLGGAATAATPLPARGDTSVHDGAGVIAPADAAAIEQLDRELFDRTGVAIVVVTVPRLVDETIDELAVRVGQSWGVGRTGEDRGLVVAFARDDRQVFVATGYGTEGYLNDARVGAILDREAIPAFRADRFSEGLRRLTASLAAASAEEYGVTLTGAPPPPPRVAEPSGPGPSTWIVGVLVLLVLGLVGRRHPGLLLWMLASGGRGGFFGGGGRGGGNDDGGFGGFGGGGFGGGGAGRSF